MMTNNKFIATSKNGDDLTVELTSFARFIGLDTVVPNRYSILLVLELFGGFKSGHLNPAKVVHEIRALEGSGPPSQTKAASPFIYPPLKGLWHKHYQEDGLSAMAFNLRKGLGKYGMPLFEQRVREAQKAGEKRYVSVDDCKLIADDLVQGNWMRLANSKSITGEWIVYAQYEGANYYLCLGFHNSEDNHKHLRDQIDIICCREFPFLSTLLVKEV